ncbi:hypothetical protein D3790_16950 [Xenorhabdus nematophila]|nr:hypothetical protein D3790_16950 [Xenorhabdus nematophila]KHD29303.1 hypothetical protein LH67_04475 [Xenorhabdus nematophila]MCB4425289.1 hypothetical protein [Xenorhabdus nematophila]
MSLILTFMIAGAPGTPSGKITRGLSLISLKYTDIEAIQYNNSMRRILLLLVTMPIVLHLLLV